MLTNHQCRKSVIWNGVVPVAKYAYRLVVSTRCGATRFCIGAADDEEALTKADRIVASLDIVEADVEVTRDALPIFHLRRMSEIRADMLLPV